MSDAARRATRTFLQSFIGVLIAGNVASLVDTKGVVDWSSARKIVISAVASGIVSLLSFIQNALEDRTSFPAILKATASSGQNPVTRDPKG